MTEFFIVSGFSGAATLIACMVAYGKQISRWRGKFLAESDALAKLREQHLTLLAVGIEVLRTSEAVEREGGCFEAGLFPHHGKFCQAPSKRCNCSRDSWEAAVESLNQTLKGEK